MMQRTPQQLAALAKSKKDQVKQTKENIESALERLRLSKPKSCDGKITVSNLCKESGVSKQTIYRYPAYLDTLNKIKIMVGKDTKSPESVHEKNRELNEIIRQLKKKKGELQKKYDLLEKKAKQEVMILNKKIASLQRSKSNKDSNIVALTRP